MSAGSHANPAAEGPRPSSERGKPGRAEGSETSLLSVHQQPRRAWPKCLGRTQGSPDGWAEVYTSCSPAKATYTETGRRWGRRGEEEGPRAGADRRDGTRSAEGGQRDLKEVLLPGGLLACGGQRTAGHQEYNKRGRAIESKHRETSICLFPLVRFVLLQFVKCSFVDSDNKKETRVCVSRGSWFSRSSSGVC